MKTVTPEEALQLVNEANTMTREQIDALQQERFDAIVAHARANSAFYKEKYADLPEKPSREQIPPVSKQELTARMNDWICDPDFDEQALTDFIHDLGTTGRLFMDKYSVSTTSGTTGQPLKMLRDARHVNINGAIMKSRLYEGAMLKGRPGLGDKTARIASVIATGGHHAALTAFEKMRKALAAEGITDTLLLLPIGDPVQDMVDKLNAFKPDIITGYPSCLHVLSGEQLEGRLDIAPKVILCSAEQLTDETRLALTKRFDCPVGNVFCSTEGGEIGILCKEGRMHLNPDWIVVEPVDRNDNPVPPGRMSDAVLVTNMSNAVQPIIRYRVDDSVVVHEEPCPCGLPFPTMDVLGRTNDMPEFAADGGGTVRLSPIVFLSAIVDVTGVSISQFVQQDPQTLTLRVQYLDDADPETVNAELEKEVREQLDANGLTGVAFTIEEREPRRAEKGKKMRAYVKDF